MFEFLLFCTACHATYKTNFCLIIEAYAVNGLSGCEGCTAVNLQYAVALDSVILLGNL